MQQENSTNYLVIMIFRVLLTQFRTGKPEGIWAALAGSDDDGSGR